MRNVLVGQALLCPAAKKRLERIYDLRLGLIDLQNASSFGAESKNYQH